MSQWLTIDSVLSDFIFYIVQLRAKNKLRWNVRKYIYIKWSNNTTGSSDIVFSVVPTQTHTCACAQATPAMGSPLQIWKFCLSSYAEASHRALFRSVWWLRSSWWGNITCSQYLTKALKPYKVNNWKNCIFFHETRSFNKHLIFKLFYILKRESDILFLLMKWILIFYFE